MRSFKYNKNNWEGEKSQKDDNWDREWKRGGGDVKRTCEKYKIQTTIAAIAIQLNKQNKM